MLPSFLTPHELKIIETNVLLSPYKDLIPLKPVDVDLAESVKEHLTKIVLCISQPKQLDAFLVIAHCCGIDDRMYSGVLEAIAGRVCCVAHKITEEGVFIACCDVGYSKENRNTSVESFVTWFVAECNRWKTAMRLKDHRTSVDEVKQVATHVTAIEVAQARLKAAAACGAEVYTISNPDGFISTVVKPKIATDDSYKPVALAARGTARVAISPDKDPWFGELRNTVDYYIANGYGITCHNILQTGVVVSILEAKGLKLGDGIQPLAHTHIRINTDKTYSRVWQLLNPRKIHFHDFIK